MNAGEAVKSGVRDPANTTSSVSPAEIHKIQRPIEFVLPASVVDLVQHRINQEQ